jgi:hypothetical protein
LTFHTLPDDQNKVKVYKVHEDDHKAKFVEFESEHIDDHRATQPQDGYRQPAMLRLFYMLFDDLLHRPGRKEGPDHGRAVCIHHQDEGPP